MSMSQTLRARQLLSQQGHCEKEQDAVGKWGRTEVGQKILGQMSLFWLLKWHSIVEVQE